MKRLSMVTTHCADSDIERTYPAIQCAINGSKATTVREMSQIVGIDYWGIRIHGSNMTAGALNSMRFCNEVLDLPSPDVLLEAFINQAT